MSIFEVCKIGIDEKSKCEKSFRIFAPTFITKTTSSHFRGRMEDGIQKSRGTSCLSFQILFKWRWIITFEALYAHPFPKSSGWVHCKGTSPKYRGYSCGLWTVFHTLTVHAFLEDGMWGKESRGQWHPIANEIPLYRASVQRPETTSRHPRLDPTLFHLQILRRSLPRTYWGHYAHKYHGMSLVHLHWLLLVGDFWLVNRFVPPRT